MFTHSCHFCHFISSLALHLFDYRLEKKKCITRSYYETNQQVVENQGESSTTKKQKKQESDNVVVFVNPLVNFSTCTHNYRYEYQSTTRKEINKQFYKWRRKLYSRNDENSRQTIYMYALFTFCLDANPISKNIIFQKFDAKWMYRIVGYLNKIR